MVDKHPKNEVQQSEVKVSSSLVWGVVASIVVPVILIILIATIVYTSYMGSSAREKESSDAIKQRIKPVGEVVVRDPNAPVILKSGEEVFKAVCISCHGSGLMNAPKLGDKAMWSKVLAQGQEVVFEHALKGIRQMPAKGGNPDFDDMEVKRAVVYMANAAGGTFSLKEDDKSSTSGNSAESAKANAASTAASTDAKKIDGQAIFNASCVACHGSGVMGAPKAGDKAAWAARIKQGNAMLYEHALKGVRLMPAKGGNPSLSEQEIKAAVDHLVSTAQ